MPPRYIRVSKGMDVGVTPTASNASMIPEDAPIQLLFCRVLQLETMDIERHLRKGIASPCGGLARIDLRHSGPHPGNGICEINNMNQTYTDSVHDIKVDCANPLNDNLPGDRTDDDIFIVNARFMREDCFIPWYDKSGELIFVDIGGLEPRYLLGAIRGSDGTMILKNAKAIEEMKAEFNAEMQKWKDNIEDWRFFKKVDYKVLDLKMEVSTDDRGDQTPPLEQNAILADGSTDTGGLPLAVYNEQTKV